ncbi:MAG: fumarylacetoacetate hydrolase family protein, partial [Atribacterota bacterium]
YELRESFFDSMVKTGVSFPLPRVRLCSPTFPSKIIAVGLNYRDHITEFGHEVPENPLLFIKPGTTVIGPEDTIILPPQSQHVDYEGELAVIIGKKARKITPEDAPRYILGLTCFNDVTARDLQRKDGQWTRAKSFDTFAPIGPWIVPGIDSSSLSITTRLNGQIKQRSNTSQLLFPVPTLVSFISQVMTLLPGDVIATGTPSGVGKISPGDVVEIEIQDIGILRNIVRGE